MHYILDMPTIAIIDGVKLYIYSFDHNPPHCHAMLGGHEVMIDLATAEVMEGSLPSAKLRKVRAWVAANRERLLADWARLHEE